MKFGSILNSLSIAILVAFTSSASSQEIKPPSVTAFLLLNGHIPLDPLHQPRTGYPFAENSGVEGGIKLTDEFGGAGGVFSGTAAAQASFGILKAQSFCTFAGNHLMSPSFVGHAQLDDELEILSSLEAIGTPVRLEFKARIFGYHGASLPVAYYESGPDLISSWGDIYFGNGIRGLQPFESVELTNVVPTTVGAKLPVRVTLFAASASKQGNLVTNNWTAVLTITPITPGASFKSASGATYKGISDAGQLSVDRIDSEIFYRWPDGLKGYTLQSSSSLEGPWVRVPTDTTLTNRYPAGAPGAGEFFRMKRE